MTKHWTDFVKASLALLLALFTPAPVARANIFQWEYTNPTYPGQGKHQSTILTSDGAGANAVPGANLSNRNLMMACLIGADLRGATATATNLANADFSSARLNGANLSQANLTNAGFTGTVLASANLTQANLTGASFGVYFNDDYGYTYYYPSADLTGANLSQANLTNASFTSAALANANLTQANLTGAYFGGFYENTESDYLYHLGANLTDVDLDRANLSGANFYSATLTNANLSRSLLQANFKGATLTGADLTGADVRGANFARTFLPYPIYIWAGGITLTQLYSTASYQAGDLNGIGLQLNDLSNGIFNGQNLTNADFAFASLTGADFSFADLRGAQGLDHFGATSRNIILPDGTVTGLDLAAGERLVVRAYDGDPSRGLGPIPVTVKNHVTLGNGSALTVNGDTLRFALTSGSPTIGTGVQAAVSGSATLELAGSVSALASATNRVNIVNNSSVSAGLLITGTHQEVGAIDGSGNTMVNAGSDLSANHIIQNAVIIGGTAANPGLVTIDASDAFGNPLGQPSGVALARSVTPNDPFGTGGVNYATLSVGDRSGLAALSPSNSVVGGSPASVPEPSALLLVLVAITGLAGQWIALRRRARSNDF